MRPRSAYAATFHARTACPAHRALGETWLAEFAPVGRAFPNDAQIMRAAMQEPAKDAAPVQGSLFG